MFNEHYGLETATLNGSKTRTSRILKLPKYFKGTNVCGFHKYTNNQGEWFTSLYDEDERDIDGSYAPFRYSEGEIVAIAQSYEDAGFSPNQICYRYIESADGYLKQRFDEQKGWNNKMFVRAEYMPHQIQITDIKLERLQDISDDDCLQEGICLLKDDKSINWKYYGVDKRSLNILGYTPKEAFYSLIEKVCGKGTWRKNPWTVVYYYKLIK